MRVLLKNPIKPHPLLFIALPLLVILHSRDAYAKQAYGCSVDGNICEDNEICIADGLFGECVDKARGSDGSIVLKEPLGRIERELLKLELKRLKSDGFDWLSARTQCFINYFKLTIVFQLQYHTDFCYVRNPFNVWQLIQVVKEELLKKNNGPSVEASIDDESVENNSELNDELKQIAAELLSENPEQSNEIENKLDEIGKYAELDDIPLNAEEEQRLEEYLNDILSDRSPDVSKLNDEQAERLLKYVHFLQSTLLDSQDGTESALKPGEAEEAIPLNVDDDRMSPLKKDTEHLGDQNTGLEKVEHKIVKGAPPLERVDSTRVYLKVKRDLDEDQLYQLVAYLEHSIAVPNELFFDDFQFDGDQLSFRVSRSNALRSHNTKRQLSSVEGIAEAVYKRRKDIETLSGVRVDETGIGSGEGVVPVESEGRDGLFMPILVICAFTITALFTVLAVHQIKQRQRNRRCTAITDVAEQIEGKPSALYQDLCRHRMSTQEQSSGTNSKHSSTSSWSEEPISHSNMDISTGHVILNFLQEYLQNPSKIEEQWSTLSRYVNSNGVSSIAEQETNKDKNRNQNFLPYDDTLIRIQSSLSDVTSSTYINACAIHDSDPRQPAYIATQSPLPSTIADFWQMIWEQGVVLIVNLANDDDDREQRCTRYWPESGSQLHGAFEIHLVSEHIWSEDYLVRSFYLKNVKTNETRTITQFHYVTWPYQSVPSTTKALLEFRRKVNKSYRGHAAPIVVHCSDGIGRTGAYCLLDIVLNRITKGVKELNIAGSLEHLRDQRSGMVETGEQYKMVFSCLAEEVTAMVKALPH